MRGTVLLTLVLLAGCASQPTGPTEAERKEYDARIARELREGEARRTRQLDANRDALDELGAFPGAELVQETRQGDDESDGDVAADELEYRVYASEVVTPYARYELLTADRWNTYRRYRLPAGTPTPDAQAFYAASLRGWAHRARERGRATGGHRLFADDFWRDGRCVWVHVGLREAPRVAPERSLTVATAATDREDCL